MKNRVVEPELLDHLPDDHPDAVASRSELLLMNRLMGNHRWILRQLRLHIEPGWRVLELGAGDGSLGCEIVARQLCASANLAAVDLARRPPSWPADAAWLQGDLLQRPLPDAEVIIANLMLHHFQDPQLRELGARIPASTRLFLSCDPARSRLSSWGGGWFGNLAELNRVTRYDMQVSIRAGFRGHELPEALGLPVDAGWQVRTSRGLFGAYRLIAWRSDGRRFDGVAE